MNRAAEVEEADSCRPVAVDLYRRNIGESRI